MVDEASCSTLRVRVMKAKSCGARPVLSGEFESETLIVLMTSGSFLIF